MSPFVFNTAASIQFGAGAMDQLGGMAAARMGTRVLLVTDPGLVETGIVARSISILEAAGIAVTVFAEVQADPPEHVIAAATEAAIAAGAGGIIGLGGGSSLDVAKLVAPLAGSR